jgi:hypothetical protein
MSVFTGDHAFALAEIAANGQPVTFTSTSEGYDPATDLVTPTTATVAGQAIQVRPSYERWRALGLIVDDVRRLLFAPTTFNARPGVGDRVQWAGDTLTVRDIEPVSPDGNTIVCYVTVGR